ncbi:MAG: hypothetical protein MJK18_11165 [Bdellovibrionales bacterium]|nr:hypothetical protein [Bdellovibrionales bacterium]
MNKECNKGGTCPYCNPKAEWYEDLKILEQFNIESGLEWYPSYREICWFVESGGLQVDTFMYYEGDLEWFIEGKIFPLDEPQKAFDKMMELRESVDDE